MSEASLRVGADEYPLSEVVLYARRDAETPGCLTIDLFADTADLTRAGVALNALTLRGTDGLSGLQGAAFHLRRDDADELNELAESVICVPGSVFELEELQLRFGRVSAEGADVQLDALCTQEGRPRRVACRVVARIVEWA